MTEERKIEILKDLLVQLSDSANILCTCDADERCEVVEECIKSLEQQPSDDCVDINHVIATISQHHFDKDKDNFDLLIHNLCKEVKALPPVTHTQCIAAVRFSKEDLKEICNERIKIEIANGTPIPDNATNGNMIKAMFPNEVFKEISEYIEGQQVVSIFGKKSCMCFDVDWWNAPYKSEVMKNEVD